MPNHYKPSPTDMSNALSLLGFTMHGEQTERDYPWLIGRLRAAVENAAAEVLPPIGPTDSEGVPLTVLAFREVFFDPQNGLSQDQTWDDYLSTLLEMAHELSHLHAAIPPERHNHFDHLAQKAAILTAKLLADLALFRTDVHAMEIEKDADDPIDPAVLVRDSARITSAIAEIMIPHDHEADEDEEDEEDEQLPEYARIWNADLEAIRALNDPKASARLGVLLEERIAELRRRTSDEQTEGVLADYRAKLHALRVELVGEEEN